MKNKKILSIIVLTSVIATQPIINYTNQDISKSNIILQVNNNKTSNFSDKEATGTTSSFSIQNNIITLNNPWEENLGSIKFNSLTSKIEYIRGNAITNPYASKNTVLFSISLYKSNGELIKSVQVNGGGIWPETELNNAFNNLSYSYGDILEINYEESSKISISNFNNQKNYPVTKTISMEITQDGLKELSNNLTVNPIYYELNSNKIDVSGMANPKSQVNVWVDGKEYITTSNLSGNYNIEISASKNITSNTEINVFNEGNANVQKKPILNSSIYPITKNFINIIGDWYGGRYNAGTISFNPATMKINITGNMNDYFANGSGNSFEISLYSSNGSLIKTETYYNSSQTQNLYNDFNNLDFKYGDIIKITILGPQQIHVSNFDNETTYDVNKTISMEITQDGLKFSKMPQIKVNPFDILGTSNNKITSGILTGTTTTKNQTVTVTVNGKTFTTKTNDNGVFSVNISDSDGFTASTNILVQTSGNLANLITPTVNSKLGILNSNITISDKDQDGTFGQMVTFNPANMTISTNNNSNFAVQLIDGKSGNIIASCSPNQFSIFSSLNNLNGAKFKYGDIIAVYEPQEIELSMGELLLNSGESKIDCTNQFKCFEITPNGLVPVENNNLTTSQILYSGSQNMDLTGKTLPNTDVTITYGNVSKVVKSNSNGDFSLEIPISEAPIGSEVKVFVNNQNISLLTVKYASNIGIINNKIEILNDTDLPIFNISFNAVSQKIQALEYPIDKTYTGTFFGNDLNIKLINPTTGQIIKNFTGNELNNIPQFITLINGISYENGDIIEISYNPQLIKANIYNGKNNIGNTTGEKEFFEITNKGLINVNDKFINVKPLDILGSTKVTSTNIEGKANPNTSVEVSVDGNVFKGTTDGNGEFNIPISDKNGFTSNTNIVISSEGYIPTVINPTIESNIQLMNSYINFYNNDGWEGNLVSSITFNPETMKFVVNNYSSSFGNGESHYFDFDLYNSNGQEISNISVNNGSTSQLTNALNGKSFNYGDIIGLSYNNSISKPVILNGSTVLGNISGDEEYFEITKSGLVRVNFGQNAYTSSVYWNNNNLVIDSNLDNGQSEETLNANKKLVILNSNNQIIDSVNTSILNNNSASVQGIIPQAVLDKLNKGETYTFALDINNKLFPIKVSSNIQSNLDYLLEVNSKNLLSISIKQNPVVTISNSSELSSYFNKINANITSTISQNGYNNNILNNQNLKYNVITNEFISRFGESELENFINQSATNKEFINWVLNNETAMEEYLEGTNPNANINGLQIWANIWNTYTNSRAGFNLKLAIAVSIADATPITGWLWTGGIGSPIERYNIFETLNAEGGMLPIFRTLDVRHLIYVVNTHIPNSKILTLRNVILQNHNSFVNSGSSGLNNIAYTIHYNETNPHTGASVFGPDFYGTNPTIYDIWYDGGVCGTTSYLGASACQVFGIPAQPVGQPGHCAFIFYNNEHKWTIGNNIYGWSQSNGADISGWSNGIATNSNITNYNLLYENADTTALRQSNEYLWLASSDISYEDKMNAINEAIKIQPLNLRAWLDKIALMKTNDNLTAQDYINLSNEIISALKDYPMPMFDTLLQIRTEILQKGTTEDYNSYVNAIKNALNSVTNSNQKSIAQDMLELMPQEDLVDNATPNIGIIILRTWGKDTDNIIFNNGVISANGSHTWVGSSNSDGININLYSPNLSLIKSFSATGEEFGADQPGYDLSDQINGTKYNNGDIISINYNPGSSSQGKLYLENKDAVTNEISNNVVFKITNNGLIPLSGTYTTPSGIKYNIVNGKIAKGQISLNTWGTIGTDVLTFNGGTIDASGQHRWIGSNNNDKISIDLCDSQGNLIKSFTATGEEFGADQPGYDLSDQINGTKYNNGDIIFINYDGGEKAHGTLTYSNGVSNVKTINNQSAFIIEGNELIPITGVKKINGKIYNFNN